MLKYQKTEVEVETEVKEEIVVMIEGVVVDVMTGEVEADALIQEAVQEIEAKDEVLTIHLDHLDALIPIPDRVTLVHQDQDEVDDNKPLC